MLEHGGRLRAAARQYGIPESDWLDLSTGINPHGWPVPAVPAEIWQALPQDDDELNDAAQHYYGTMNCLEVSGSQAAIQSLPMLRPPTRVALLATSYAEHAHAWQRHGHEVVGVHAEEILHIDDDVSVVVIVNPNNPTGKLFSRDELLSLHAQLVARGGWLVVDEAFMDATPEHSLASACPRAGLIVLRSLGKFFGLAGARVGFVLAEQNILEPLAESLGPWTIAAPSRHVATLALRDTAWQRATREVLPLAEQRLAELLRAYGLTPSGGSSLFQWVKTEHAETIHQQLARQGVLTRLYEAPHSLRFGLPRDEAQWARLAEALGVGRDLSRHNCHVGINPDLHSSARTVMVQGTTSDAGKSTLVAALCRWLVRQGVAVAPFKPQNMALNSAVTGDGGEIGRAQAVQAQAARLAPHTDMNPVLLKPNSDTGAQVIIHGHAIGNMDALEYHAYKNTARAAVLQSHKRLSEQYSVVVVEGAGSPAEINLREGDIANMGFAEAVDCPVILIADIDRGGVFAHLVGTLELLSESEQARVVGFVINRFRGDLALLQPGLDWLEQRTGKPVIGVLPYLRDFHLEAEDAVPPSPQPSDENTSHSIKSPKDGDQVAGYPACGRGSKSKLRVIVPVLPHISNHTDFDPLCLHPQVEFSFVALGAAIPDETTSHSTRPANYASQVAGYAADLIVLPGSKSVRSDLDSLRKAGWEDAIQRHLRYGGKLIGICGGLQMLGCAIHDPLGIEGEPGSSVGLGLLELSTTLAAEKQLRNVRGTLMLEDAPVSGYEIHAGISTGRALQHPAVQLEHGADGAISDDGQILATYLHGLFESRQATDALLRWAGLREVVTPDYHARREADIDRLADMVEQHLDGKQLRVLFGLGGNATHLTVRGEPVEPPAANKEPIDKAFSPERSRRVRANGVSLK